MICIYIDNICYTILEYSNNSDKNPMQLGLWSTIYRVNMDTLQFNRKVIIPPWNFIYFNVIKGVASVFGVHPWHWYLTQVSSGTSIYTYTLYVYGLYIHCYLKRCILGSTHVTWCVYPSVVFIWDIR